MLKESRSGAEFEEYPNAYRLGETIGSVLLVPLLVLKASVLLAADIIRRIRRSSGA